MTQWDAETLEQAVETIANADALLVGAGAGMGVDSGLPDFRGDKGFWKAYPPFKRLGLSFIDLANPRWFDDDPDLAWGFYGHRLHLYRDTQPHEGFALLHKWSQRMEHGLFVFTSNVDGQFQLAGFPDERVLECHGSLHHFQCSLPCDDSIWADPELNVTLNEETFRARPPLPACPRCGRISRPNVLMFGDISWLSERTAAQEERYMDWLDQAEGGRIAVVECGAGTAIPSVRWACERISRRSNATLIRVNPREAHGPRGTLSFSAGALEVLQAIDERLS
ncbi:MAG: NAD-dependent protein deacetylase [Deltaproteobacteria bacterium]|nr:MAG: NAD-dependent protein deacetylase [Deltaproteobacteria bacterium]